MKYITIILDAPRSGASLLTSCLRLLGCAAPVSSASTDPGIITSLFFQELDLDPLMIGGLPEDWQQSKAATKAKQRIKALLLTCKQEQAPCILSAPGMTRIIPLWLNVLQEINIEPKIIHILRHPWETAQSLNSNKSMELYKAHLLWLAYNRDALAGCVNHQHILITFDQLLADPVTTLKKVGLALGLAFPRDMRAAYYDLLDFVQPSLKHHYAGSATESSNASFAPFTRYYDSMRLVQAGIATKSNSRDMVSVGKEDNVSGGGKILDIMFKVLGEYEHREHDLRTREAQLPNASRTEPPLFATLSIPTSVGEYREKRFHLLPDQWQKISLNIPVPDLLNTTPLRFSPLNTTGAATISSVKLINRVTGEVLWSAQAFEDDNLVSVEGTALRVPAKDNLALLITGKEPVITLKVPAQIPDCPAQAEIWFKVSKNQVWHHEALQTFLNLENWKTLLGITPQDSSPDSLLRLAAVFETAGCLAEADAVLEKGLENQPEEEAFRMPLAELSMKLENWPEAIRRWQNVVALQGESTPAQVYQRLDEAYQKQKSFPKGSAEEEVGTGDGDKHEMLTLIHHNLAPDIYLEIGVQSGKSLALAKCEAIGVDPMPHVNIALSERTTVMAMTSDEFFHGHAASLVKNPPDLVFIDGMHLFEYTLRDFMHVERLAAPCTLVVIDDIFPAHPAQAERRRRTRTWTGDVWKVFEILSRYRPDLFFLPVNTSPTGLLLIAGLQPANQVLWDNYDSIASKYSADMKPPEAILKRDGVLSSKHDAISRILAALKTGREEKLESETVTKHLKKELIDACKGSRPRFPFIVGSKKKHVIISGTGRAGTTLLVQLFTAIGLDTGFNDIDSKIYSEPNAGMELNLRKENAPYIVKDPRLCDYLEDAITKHDIIIDHAIIPVRDLYSSAESRRDVQRRTREWKNNSNPPGGLWDTDRPEELEKVLGIKMHKLIHTITKYDIPFTLLDFPRFANDSEYLYNKLRFLFKDITFDKFTACYDKIVHTELIHNFD